MRQWHQRFVRLFVLLCLLLLPAVSHARNADCRNVEGVPPQQILRDVYSQEPNSAGLVDIAFSVEGPRRAAVWRTFLTPPEQSCAFVALTQARLLCSDPKLYCPEGFDTTGRFRGAEIGVALYERIEDEWRLVGKNPVAATWGNWNSPPGLDTLQITWLRTNVALIASGISMSGAQVTCPVLSDQF
jgi:hypothetical protein